MDKVEGMIRGLQLSATEKKQVCMGSGLEIQGKTEATLLKAFGKLLSERHVRLEAIEQVTGWIWCMRGIECKDLGGNFFLFTFGQVAGK